MTSNASKCRLCGRRRPLKESHILSKFVYKPIKRDDRTLILMSDHPAIPTRTDLQDGFKERLLCEGCEGKRSKWETYFANKVNRNEFYRDQTIYTIEHLDYKMVKLFLMSTLFMSAVARHWFFSQMKVLSPSRNRLRRMLNMQHPGSPEEFGAAVFLLEECDVAPDTLVLGPKTTIDPSCRIHTFIFQALFFFFVETKHSLHEAFVDRLLTPEGAMIIEKKRLGDVSIIRDSFRELVKQGKA